MAGRKRECPVCHLQQVWLVGEQTFVAHFFQGDRRWCPGGKPPTKAQKAARKEGKKGHSIRGVSGGLPGLGR